MQARADGRTLGHEAVGTVVAREFGADMTINNSSEDPIERVRNLGDGLGVDVAIEAVGVPSTFELCTEIVRPGGHVANVGVHGQDTSSTPRLLRLIAEGRLDPLPLVTHRFKLDEMLDAYEVFANAAETDALKVVLSAA